MFEYKCFKNMTGFIVTKPPCVVFTLCLATFAVGLVSLGLYVMTHDFPETDPSKDWYAFLSSLSQVSVCVPTANITGEQQNHTASPSHHQYFHLQIVNVSIPLLISFLPLRSLVEDNYTQITTYLNAADIGIKDKHEIWHKINFTIGIDNSWTKELCSTPEDCKPVTVNACITLSAPVSVLPPGSRLHEKCSNSTLPRALNNIHASYHVDTVSQPAKVALWCQGTLLHTESPTNIMQSMISADEQTKANLHLQYSSYVLFVMVITCVIYAMIKGKPFKSAPKKAIPLI